MLSKQIFQLSQLTWLQEIAMEVQVGKQEEEAEKEARERKKIAALRQEFADLECGARESPVWGLALHTWCKENCPLGVCPKNFCTCIKVKKKKSSSSSYIGSCHVYDRR